MKDVLDIFGIKKSHFVDGKAPIDLVDSGQLSKAIGKGACFFPSKKNMTIIEIINLEKLCFGYGHINEDLEIQLEGIKGTVTDASVFSMINSAVLNYPPVEKVFRSSYVNVRW